MQQPTNPPEEKHPPINRDGPWTVPEYAAYYRVSRATIYNWLKADWLQSAKIGGARRILPLHDEAFRARFAGGDSA